MFSFQRQGGEGEGREGKVKKLETTDPNFSKDGRDDGIRKKREKERESRRFKHFEEE